MISDIVKLKKWLVKSGEFNDEDLTKYDLNNDGKINVFDLIILKRKIINGIK